MSHDPYPPHPSRSWQPPPPAPPAPPGPPPRPHGHRPAPAPDGDLRLLRSAYRWQRRVATFTALGYFVLFLVLSAFTPSLMMTRVATGLPLGLLLALLQLPVTWLAIGLYERTARERVDPLADRIRKQSEHDARRDARAHATGAGR